MNEIEIRVLDMSAVLKPSDAFALVLEELGGGFRKLALIIGKQEAQAIKMGQMSYTPPRPFTHDLMLSVMEKGGLVPVKGVIYEVKDGIYSSYLFVRCANETIFQVDARTTDVISLSLRKKFPLYVYEDILEREQLRNISADGSTYCVSINTIDIDSLKKAMDEAIASMTTLNKYAAEVAKNYHIHACSDVTGFGLLGHLHEMLDGKYSCRIHTVGILTIEGAKDYANEFLITAAAQKNRNHVESFAEFHDVDFAMEEILFDPQTSGGLLFSLAKEEASDFLLQLQNQGINAFVVGEIIEKAEKEIYVEGK